MHTSLKRILPPLLVILTLVLLISWLELTPPGLMGKLDAIGFAVCHQIPERSFDLAERPLPLCARCSGMYLGIWVGMVFLLGQGRKGGFPRKAFAIFFLAFSVVFVLDGVNSYLTFFIPNPLLYAPQNWLRLFTGSIFGLTVAAFFAPVVNQTLWINVTLEPSLHAWKQLVGLIGGVALLNLAMLTENPLLVYPLSILASLTVLLLLSTAYSLAWVLITRRENTFLRFSQLKWHALGGFTTALLQIILVDALRFFLTGAWRQF